MQPEESKSKLIENGGGFLLIIVCCLAIVALIALITSCKHIEYVTVPEVHEIHHYSTDSIFKTDSVIDRQTTVVREVDSATMAQYGIQLKNAERAWLVQNERLLKEIDRLREAKADSLYIHDSIPYPVPVTVKEPYVPTLVKFLAWAGGIVIAGLVIWIAFRIGRKKILF